MGNYILSLDQGTTSSRAILFNRAGNIVSLAQREFTQYYPSPGHVEHDPTEIWSSQVGVATEAMKSIGCKVDGILRSNMPKREGGRRDSIVLSILKDEWENDVKEMLRRKIEAF